MTGPERRATILRAAIDEFTRVGYHGATTAMIARTAGCSEPTLYKHVRDKRELLIACLQETEDRVERELQQVITMPDPVAEMGKLSLTSPHYRDMLRLRLLCTSLADDADVRTFLQTAADRMEQRMGAAIEHALANREPMLDDAPLATWLWIGLSFACYEELALHGEDAFSEGVRRRARVFTNTMHRPELPDAAPEDLDDRSSSDLDDEPDDDLAGEPVGAAI